jgi:hypothetical protein
VVVRRYSDADLRRDVLGLLEAHWDVDRGFCVPNPATYPHLWLWDSCFHAVVWAHVGDSRAAQELTAALEGQLPGGLVPHMRYGTTGPDTWLGPLATTSSLAQPPMFGHAVKVLIDHGIAVPARTIARARRGLEWLWSRRRTERDLLYVVHPWEAGNDHSPRWDDWGAPGTSPGSYDRAARTAWNKARMADVTFHDDGAAAWSSTFVACPAGFNAYVAFNLAELAVVLEDRTLFDHSRRIAAAMDEHLWDDEQQLWSDLALVGGRGSRVTTPISDGLMGALATTDATRAAAVLAQLELADRFSAPFGPTNVARSDPAYDPRMYWRGVAWPPLSYLLWLALRRWHRFDQAANLARRNREAAIRNGWAEYWDPETGEGLGAIPQSWTGLVLAMDPRADRSTG